MAILFANNAFGTLATSINTTATSISLQSGQGARFPSPTGGDIFYATLVNQANELEIVKCTGRVNDTLTVQRAQEGTPARSFVAGDRVELRLTAAGLSDFAQDEPTVARLDKPQTFTEGQTFGGPVVVNNGITINGSVTGFPRAAAEIDGTVRARLSGSTLFITNNGNNA